MRAIIAMCTMVICLGVAGLAVSTHGYSAPNASEPGCQQLPRTVAVHA